MRQLVLLIIYTSLLTACAGTVSRPVPGVISHPPSNDLQLAEVINTPEEFKGSRIRWGGSILSTQKHTGYLYVEILQRPLNADGKPEAGHQSDGRFISHIPEPYDIKHYYRGRHITVTGILDTPLVKSLNEQTVQTLPLVKAQDHYVWNYYPHHYRYNVHYHYHNPPHYHGYRYGPYYPRYYRHHYYRRGFYRHYGFPFRNRYHHW